MYELKIYTGVTCNDTEELWKTWRGIDFLFQNWHQEFDEFWLKNLKVSKMYTFMGCFWPKYIISELKKHRGVMFHSTGYWSKIWRETDLCFQKWHEEFSKFSPEYIRKPRNWDFHWLLLYKAENIWA